MNIPTGTIVHADEGRVSKAERLGLGSPISKVTDGRSESEQLADKLEAALKYFGYTIHPKAQETPSLTMAEYMSLRQLIGDNGQLIPVLMQGNMLVDGRHRVMACYDFGFDPRVKQVHESADLESVIYDAEARRHQTKSQMAAFTVLFYEDKVRELTEAGMAKQRHEKPITVTVMSPGTFVSQTAAVGINAANMAVALLNAGRVDLLIDVRDGTISSMEKAYQQHLDEVKGAEDKPEQYALLVNNLTKVGNALKAASTNVAEIRERLAFIEDDGTIEAFCVLVEKVTTALEDDHTEVIARLAVKEADDA